MPGLATNTIQTLAGKGGCAKSNSTFKGWDCGNGIVTSVTINNANVTCTAQWTGPTPACDEEPYTESKADELHGTCTHEVSYDPTDPTCSRKNPGPWNCSCDDGYEPNAAGDGCVATPAQTYTITYNCKDGSAGNKTQTCTADIPVRLAYETSVCGSKTGIDHGREFNFGKATSWYLPNSSTAVPWTYNCDADIEVEIHWTTGGGTGGANWDGSCYGPDDGVYGGCMDDWLRCDPTDYAIDRSCKGPCEGIQSDPNDDFTKVYPQSSTNVCPDGPSTDGTPGGCVAKYCKCGPYSYNTVDDNDKPICKKITTFTLRYDCGSYAATGTPPASKTYEEGELVELAQDWGTCEFSGHRFAGWNCTGLPENNIIVSNVDCSAMWEKI